MDRQDHLLISPVHSTLSPQGDEVEAAKVRVILVQRHQGSMCSTAQSPSPTSVPFYDLLFFIQIQEQFRQRWSKGRGGSPTHQAWPDRLNYLNYLIFPGNETAAWYLVYKVPLLSQRISFKLSSISDIIKKIESLRPKPSNLPSTPGGNMCFLLGQHCLHMVQACESSSSSPFRHFDCHCHRPNIAHHGESGQIVGHHPNCNSILVLLKVNLSIFEGIW